MDLCQTLNETFRQVSLNRKIILLAVFELARLRRMRLQAWAVEDETKGTGDVLTIQELFQSTTDAIWGEGLFSGQRVKLWRNWEIMLFWVEVLQASMLTAFFFLDIAQVCLPGTPLHLRPWHAGSVEDQILPNALQRFLHP